jgi:hypothetical protein
MNNEGKKQAQSFKQYPYKVFLTLFLVSLFICIYALRQNNQTMIQLRNEVYAADKNNGDVNKALNNLRAYVYAHMNTNLSSGNNAIKPPIQLKYTYERLQSKEQKKANSTNSQIYTDAQAYCQQLNPTDFSGRNRVPCVQNYVTSHGGVGANAVPVSLYQYDFISPAWSPDLAGWSLILSIFFFLLLVASFFIQKLVNTKLKQL